MEYLIVKWLHIGFSTILFGTGIGSAFFFLSASRNGDAGIAAFVTGRVVLADWLFTTPMVILQPASGFYLLHLAGIPASMPWIAWSLWLYGFAVLCWLPVVVLQIRMRALAREAAATAQPLPARFGAMLRAWIALGAAAFIAFVAIFYLMVVKVVPW